MATLLRTFCRPHWSACTCVGAGSAAASYRKLTPGGSSSTRRSISGGPREADGSCGLTRRCCRRLSTRPSRACRYATHCLLASGALRLPQDHPCHGQPCCHGRLRLHHPAGVPLAGQAGSAYPWVNAKRVAWARSRAPVLAKIRFTCVFTVASLTYRVLAISRLEWPAAIRRSTSASRGVRSESSDDRDEPDLPGARAAADSSRCCTSGSSMARSLTA